MIYSTRIAISIMQWSDVLVFIGDDFALIIFELGLINLNNLGQQDDFEINPTFNESINQ